MLNNNVTTHRAQSLIGRIVIGSTLATISYLSDAQESSQKYTVDLSQPHGVGQRIETDLVTELRIEDKLFRGEKLVNQATHSVHLEMKKRGEVLEIDSKKQPTSIRWTVVSASATIDGNPTDAPAPGTVVEARHNEVIGIPRGLNSRVTEMVKSSLSASDPESPNEGEVFGTSEPRAVGETWDIRVDEFLAEFWAPLFKYDKAQITKSARISEIVDIDGADHLKVDVEIIGAQVEPLVESGFTLDKAAAKTLVSFYIPVTPGKHRDRVETSFEFTATIHSSDGRRAERKYIVQARTNEHTQ